MWDKLISYVPEFIPLILEKIKGPKIPLLFTTSNPTASFSDIAENLSRTHRLPENKILGLLLQGYWNGYFEDKETEAVKRLDMLKIMHDLESVSQHFIFAYKHDTPPATSEDLPDGGVRLDMRPVLPVPDANTNNWTIENCQKAFEKLAKESTTIYPNASWPEYIPELMLPTFGMIKISYASYKKFVKKEKLF